MHSGRMLFKICMASVSSCRTPLTMLVTQVASSLTRRWVLMRASSSDLFNGFLHGVTPQRSNPQHLQRCCKVL